MFILMRALTYASLFVTLLLVFVPVRLLSWTGIGRPERTGVPQVLGLIIVLTGAALAAWCVVAFAFLGRGTPAPFDAPRRLVVSGPYGRVRNPMYLGAVVALAGAALFFGSAALFGYAVLFLLVAHLFVLLYEEPTLARLFGAEYDAYRARVRRWLPRRAGQPNGASATGKPGRQPR